MQVLYDVSMAIDAGEIVALLRSNGAGKSTLINVVIGGALRRPARPAGPLVGARGGGARAGAGGSEQSVMQSLAIAHRASVIESGRLTLSGTAAELIENPGVRRSYLGL